MRRRKPYDDDTAILNLIDMHIFDFLAGMNITVYKLTFNSPVVVVASLRTVCE